MTESILRVPDLNERLSIPPREILALLEPTIKGAICLVEHGRLILKVEESLSSTFLALGRDVLLDSCPWKPIRWVRRGTYVV